MNSILSILIYTDIDKHVLNEYISISTCIFALIFVFRCRHQCCKYYLESSDKTKIGINQRGSNGHTDNVANQIIRPRGHIYNDKESMDSNSSPEYPSEDLSSKPNDGDLDGSSFHKYVVHESSTDTINGSQEHEKMVTITNLDHTDDFVHAKNGCPHLSNNTQGNLCNDFGQVCTANFQVINSFALLI